MFAKGPPWMKVFEGLHEVRLDGVFKEHRHCAVRFEFARRDGFVVVGVGDDYVGALWGL